MNRKQEFTDAGLRLIRNVQRVLDENDVPASTQLTILSQMVGKLSYELSPQDEPNAPGAPPAALTDCIIENILIGRDYAKGQ